MTFEVEVTQPRDESAGSACSHQGKETAIVASTYARQLQDHIYSFHYRLVHALAVPCK